MMYKFSNIDEELKQIQQEILKSERIRLVKDETVDNIIYLKKSNTPSLDGTCFTSSHFHGDAFKYITSNDLIVLNDKNTSREEAINLFFDQLYMYYLIYKTPNFDFDNDELKYFLNVLYDYIVSNKKGSFFEITFTINRYVIAYALLCNSPIKIIDYINQLGRLSLFGFTDEEINEIKGKLKFGKIMNFNIK